MYDILSIEKNHGLDLPKWTEKVYPEKLLAIAERTMAVLTENKFMKRVKGGEQITKKYISLRLTVPKLYERLCVGITHTQLY